jgi:hypothetical protein
MVGVFRAEDLAATCQRVVPYLRRHNAYASAGRWKAMTGRSMDRYYTVHSALNETLRPLRAFVPRRLLVAFARFPHRMPFVSHSSCWTLRLVAIPFGPAH